MKTSLAPRFAGQHLFGEQKRFIVRPLVGGAASIDVWLLNSPGTTAGPPQQAWGLSGLLVGPTSASVQQAIDLLRSFVGCTSAFGFPTASRLPGDNFAWTPRPTYFVGQEFKPGSISLQPGNKWAAPYRMVMRST